MSNNITTHIENPRSAITAVHKALYQAAMPATPRKVFAQAMSIYYALEFLSDTAFNLIEGRDDWHTSTSNGFRWSLMKQMEAVERLSPQERAHILSAIECFRERLIALQGHADAAVKLKPQHQSALKAAPIA